MDEEPKSVPVEEDQGPQPSEPKGQKSRTPEIIGLRPSVTGVFVLLGCRSCKQAFERFQPTVAGVALGLHACPNCHDLYEVKPEDFEAALDRFLPPRSLEEMTAVTEEATRVAETWHQSPPLARLLTYKGFNLGEPTERFLLSHVALGLYPAQGGPENQR